MRPAGALLVVGLLAGCGAAAPGGGDAAAYTEALTSEAGYAPASAACRRIDDARVRGDCLLALMERWEQLDEAACDALEDRLWRDECRFQLAERRRAAGDLAAAIQTCDRTRFRRSCAWHLLQDEAQDSLEEAPAVAEARLAPFAAARPVPDAGVQFWMIRFRERSARGHALDEAACQGLQDPASCERAVYAYVRGMMDELGRKDPSRLCAAAPGDRVHNKAGAAWVLGPIVRRAEDRWVFERCGEGAPPPPPGAPNPTLKAPGER